MTALTRTLGLAGGGVVSMYYGPHAVTGRSRTTWFDSIRSVKILPHFGCNSGGGITCVYGILYCYIADGLRFCLSS